MEHIGAELGEKIVYVPTAGRHSYSSSCELITGGVFVNAQQAGNSPVSGRASERAGANVTAVTLMLIISRIIITDRKSTLCQRKCQADDFCQSLWPFCRRRHNPEHSAKATSLYSFIYLYINILIYMQVRLLSISWTWRKNRFPYECLKCQISRY